MGHTPSRIFAAVLIALALGSASVPRQWFVDDAYITFHYAENLAQGQGLVFNPGERVFGCTTPLYALLLAGAAELGVRPELSSRLLAGLGLAALFLALLSLSRSIFADPWPGLLASVFLLTNPVVLFNGLSGMETNFFLALWAWAFAALARGRPGSALLLAALSLWCRIEGGVVMGIILGMVWLRRENHQSWRRWVPGLALAGLYPVLAWLYYGSLVPQSFARKLETSSEGWAGSLEILKQFGMVFIGKSSYWYGLETAFWALIPFGLIGLVRLRRESAGKWAPFLAGLGLYLLAYAASGRSYARNFPWYFLPPLLGLYLLSAEGVLSALARATRSRRFFTGRPAVLPVLLALLWIGALLPTLVKTAELRSIKIYSRERLYAAAAQWANAALAPGEILASNEVGAIAYFSGRKVLDLFGILSAEPLAMIEAVKKDRPAVVVFTDRFTAQQDLERALPGRYHWQKWRRLWIGVRADLPLAVPESELERRYGELPL